VLRCRNELLKTLLANELGCEALRHGNLSSFLSQFGFCFAFILTLILNLSSGGTLLNLICVQFYVLDTFANNPRRL
jgi:hypothetical protein